MSEKVLRQEIYNIKPFREVLVTDPWYLEQEDTKNCPDLVFHEKPRCCKFGKILIKEISDSYDNLDYKQIDISIILTAHERQMDVYLDDKMHKGTIKRQESLGCDTAQFMMQICNKKGQIREIEIDTGADGYYGQATKYKEGYGMRIDLWLDADVVSFEEIRQEMSYLLDFNLEKDLVCSRDTSDLEQEMEQE